MHEALPGPAREALRARARGVSAAWCAIDLRPGETEFSRRTVVGPLFDDHYAAVTLGQDGSAYIATMGGMPRIRDRP